MSLRPIGTEFWHEFPVDGLSTVWFQSRFLYRIVNYALIVGGRTTETLAVIAEQRRPITGMKLVKLSDRQIWDYEFGEWSEVS